MATTASNLVGWPWRKRKEKTHHQTFSKGKELLPTVPMGSSISLSFLSFQPVFYVNQTNDFIDIVYTYINIHRLVVAE